MNFKVNNPKFRVNSQRFAAETGITSKTDVKPELSIYFSNRLTNSIIKLMEILGVAELTPVAQGSTVKVTTRKVETLNAQDEEGNTIALTEVVAKTTDVPVELRLYRKSTTAQAIQASGVDNAVTKTDAEILKEIYKGIKSRFFSGIQSNPVTVEPGKDLQAAAAKLWAHLEERFEDSEATPLFFVNPHDVADYLGTASIISQSEFGLRYIENFCGLGTGVITTAVDRGTLVGTVTENINGVYVPASGDVGQAFDLETDESGLVGMTHSKNISNGTYDTLFATGASFFVEDGTGVFLAPISAEDTEDNNG